VAGKITQSGVHKTNSLHCSNLKKKIKNIDIIGKFFMRRKLRISLKISVDTPVGRKPLGAIGRDEITSELQSARAEY
jgi:hypothetical protein